MTKQTRRYEMRGDVPEVSNTHESTNPFTQGRRLACCCACYYFSFPLVTLSTKCLLSASCTRWNVGVEFGHPVTVVYLHLISTGLVSILASNLCPFQRNGNDCFLPCRRTLRDCLVLGLGFGIKYCVGHWTLKVTPAYIFELFHSVHIVWIALSAHILLNESITWHQIACGLGIVVGCLAMNSQKLYLMAIGSVALLPSDNGLVALVIALNVVNGIIAGLIVVLLRSIILLSNSSALQITGYKMLFGGLLVLPVGVLLEGVTTLQTMTPSHLFWTLVSSVCILVYHWNLSLLCLLAESANTVAVVESLRPLPAFFIVAGLQQLPESTAAFWLGSLVVLVSAVFFHFPVSRSAIRGGGVYKKTSKLQRQRQSSEVSDVTEATRLLDERNKHSNNDGGLCEPC